MVGRFFNIKIWLVILLVLSIGGGVFLGYAYIQLSNERDALDDELHRTARMAKALKNKYAQEKARVSGLIRAKSLLEGQIRTLHTDIEKMEEERDAVLTELKEMKKSHGSVVVSLEKKMKKLEAQYEKLKTIQAKTAQQYKGTAEQLRERKEEVVKLTADKRGLQANLKKAQQDIERMIKHNKTLCVLADELIEKYRAKRVSDTIMEKEPFTQINKVKLEHLIQEYQDRVDKADVGNH